MSEFISRLANRGPMLIAAVVIALLIVFPVGTFFGTWLLMGSWKPWPDPRMHAGAPRGGWHQDGRR